MLLNYTELADFLILRLINCEKVRLARIQIFRCESKNAKDNLFGKEGHLFAKEGHLFAKRDTYLPKRDIYLQSRDTYLPKRDIYLQSRDTYLPKRDIYLQSRDTYLHKRTQICRRGSIICPWVRSLMVLLYDSKIHQSFLQINHICSFCSYYNFNQVVI